MIIMKELLVWVTLILSTIIQLNAQTQILGKVVDGETDEPLIGLSVMLKGSNIGTVTDLEGNYSLSIEEQGKQILVFSYVGYQTLEKKITIADEQAITMNIKMTSGLLGEVVIVTDGKYEKKLEESTVSVDVINQQMIENNNVTSLDDVVKKVSGVQLMDGQVSIRSGAGYAYGAGSRVSFLVDGQLLLSAELSDVKWNFIPIENAEQIEVIKGAASVLYGSGALNGVINVRTAYPKKNKPYTAFTLYSGVYSQPRTDSTRWYDPKENFGEQPMFMGAFFAHRQKMFDDNFDLVLGGNFHIENGFIKGNDERRFRINFNTRYRPSEQEGRLFFGVNGNIMYHEISQFFLAKDMYENAYRNISEGGRDRYTSITIDPYVTVFDDFENKHDIRARWFRISKERGGKGKNSNGDLMSLEYQFQREFNHGWRLTAGLLGQHFRANSILFADPNDPNNEKALFGGSSFAAYAQVDKKFFDRLTATVGVRWEGFLVDTAFTPALPITRFGLNFEASKNDYIRASFGQGFRFPSLAERYINEPIPTNGISVSVFPNPNIRPETGWSAELAYRHNFIFPNFRFYTDLAFFWMEYQNMVEYSLVFSPSIGFQSQNIGGARIAGWELSLGSEGRIGKVPLRIWGGYTYSSPGDLERFPEQKKVGVYLKHLFQDFAKGIDRNDQDIYKRILKYRSLHTFRMDVETEYKGFIVGSSLNFNSFIHGIDQVFVFGFITPGMSKFRDVHNKGAWIWDLRLGYRFNKKQNLSLVINNVLNTEYASRPARMGQPQTFSIKYNHVF